MAEIPEMMRGRIDLYADPLYRKALRTYAELATPLGTQPPLDDSPAEYRLQPLLVDAARIRMGLLLPRGPETMAGFGMRSVSEVGNNSGYVPTLDGIPADEDRHPLDGPVGFGSVGHIPRRPRPPSHISLFNEERPAPSEEEERSAANRYCAERGLVCLGFGRGKGAVQLYCDGGDSRRGHRHLAPLSLLLFAGGREVLPDLGYIADHPANNWIRATASHNTVVVDERSVRAVEHCVLNGLVEDGPFRFFDVTTRVAAEGDGKEVEARFRRAVLLLRKSDGLPIVVDVFDVEGGEVHDYVVRANDPEQVFDLPGTDRMERSPLFGGAWDPGPFGFRTAGPASSATATWGRAHRLTAHVLTPCDEVVTFKSPAWRNQMEVFAEPQWSWEALVLRSRGGRSRFAVVYEIGDEEPSIGEAVLTEADPTVQVRLDTKDGPVEVVIEDGTCRTQLPGGGAADPSPRGKG